MILRSGLHAPEVRALVRVENTPRAQDSTVRGSLLVHPEGLTLAPKGVMLEHGEARRQEFGLFSWLKDPIEVPLVLGEVLGA